MHEAIIDAEWDKGIKPILLERFPQATPEQLRTAKSYAYGGSVAQDMGYYPFSDHFLSHLMHYVRSGDFVQALFDESRDINEYAFALGALSHYSADIQGHSLGVNRAVPLLYPGLRKKYGDTMSWEDSPYAHVLTEFAFDTLEVVAGHVAPQKYHEWIGFRVPQPVLRRAFRKTYGLDLSDEVLSPSLAFFTYREFASRVIPEMTEVAWALRGKSLDERATGLHHRSLFHLHRADIGSWKATKGPEPGDRLTAFIFRLIPKFGPLNAFDFHTPTDQTEQLFAESLKATVADYKLRLNDDGFDPPDTDLDTGRPTRPGEYRFCDQTYAKLLHRLKLARFAMVTPALRENLLGFYNEPDHNAVRKKRRQWQRVQHDLKDLKAAPIVQASK